MSNVLLPMNCIYLLILLLRKIFGITAEKRKYTKYAYHSYYQRITYHIKPL